ncbi:hypothetical protein QFZ74_000550 [Streptomyces sp. V3I7]|nr:hypothetical protein [Streptomyces sp. V3I7]
MPLPLPLPRPVSRVPHAGNIAVMVTYDRIGATYSATRRPDPRVADRIERALGDAATVVNVGGSRVGPDSGRPQVSRVRATG